MLETVDVEARLRGEHDLIVPTPQRARSLELGDDDVFIDQVRLGYDENFARMTHGAHLSRDPFVAAADRLARIDQKRDDVDVFHGHDGAGVELFAQRVVELVQTRSVDHDHLHVLACDNGAEAMAGRLRRVGGDGHLVANNRINQRGFTGIRSADKRHETAFERISHEKNLRFYDQRHEAESCIRGTRPI